MSDLRFEVAEDGLEEDVLLVDNLFVVQNLLHFLVVRLVGEHSQPHQLVLILVMVEDGLGYNNVCINLVVKGSKSGPR